MVRRRKRNVKDRSKIKEFDVIAVWDDKVIINETKSNPRIEYINEFIEVLKEIVDYFPEFEGKKIIPIFSSPYLPNENTMDFLNFEKIKIS